MIISWRLNIQDHQSSRNSKVADFCGSIKKTKFFAYLPPESDFCAWIFGGIDYFVFPMRIDVCRRSQQWYQTLFMNAMDVLLENTTCVSKEYVIEELVPDEPAANAPIADKDKFKKHMDDMLDVSCLMLATMSPDLQKQYDDMNAYDMVQNLKEIYEGQVRQERYETSKALFQCKMSEGSPVGAHVIKMMGYI
ncbi:hypothetical protein V6N13_026615 [Hibiscus sabdariffa]